MIYLTVYQRSWIKGWLKGKLIAYFELLRLRNLNPSVYDEELARVMSLPRSLIRSVTEISSLDICDPDYIVDQIDLNSADFMSWYETSERKGVIAYIQHVCETRFGELPDWVLSKLDSAQVEELQKWLYSSQKEKYLEQIFLEFELSQQVLQAPPEHWEEKTFTSGMRRVLRIQFNEKFGELPLCIDELLYRLKYEQLVQLSKIILNADGLK